MSSFKLYTLIVEGSKAPSSPFAVTLLFVKYRSFSWKGCLVPVEARSNVNCITGPAASADCGGCSIGVGKSVDGPIASEFCRVMAGRDVLIGAGSGPALSDCASSRGSATSALSCFFDSWSEVSAPDVVWPSRGSVFSTEVDCVSPGFVDDIERSPSSRGGMDGIFDSDSGCFCWSDMVKVVYVRDLESGVHGMHSGGDGSEG